MSNLSAYPDAKFFVTVSHIIKRFVFDDDIQRFSLPFPQVWKTNHYTMSPLRSRNNLLVFPESLIPSNQFDPHNWLFFWTFDLFVIFHVSNGKIYISLHGSPENFWSYLGWLPPLWPKKSPFQWTGWSQYISFTPLPFSAAELLLSHLSFRSGILFLIENSLRFWPNSDTIWFSCWKHSHPVVIGANEYGIVFAQKKLFFNRYLCECDSHEKYFSTTTLSGKSGLCPIFFRFC